MSKNLKILNEPKLQKVESNGQTPQNKIKKNSFLMQTQ